LHRIPRRIDKIKVKLAYGFLIKIKWKQDTNGWWYQNDNGGYPVNCWQDINGKQYYFNESGYILTNTTTPDGKQVGADGAMMQAPLFDFDINDSHIKYTKHELSTDYEGNACVIVYYDFTINQIRP
jgi:hypothetical protein